MKITTSLFSVLAVTLSVGLLVTACVDHTLPSGITYPAIAEATNPALIQTVNGVRVNGGGFGSAVVADPKDPAVFYLLTDRGPNIDGTIANSKVFAKPDFVPQIGKFRLVNGQLILERTIELINLAGTKLNGLPNPIGQGNTGEIALDLMGNTIPSSVDGIDSEGLVMAPDRSFWISDEYGPHLLHVDENGRTLERVNPFGTGTGGRTIPLVFARRRPNRGMEGLAITPDGKTLVGLMQFPLFNPTSAAVANSLVTRILTFDIASGATRQYVVMMERANLQAFSEITAITNSTFLVLERDGEYGTNANRTTLFKRVYKIDLTNATDISDPANGVGGKLFGGKTVEELKDAATLQANGIVPVTKSLVLDLATELPLVYPHDKAEGLALLSPTLLAVSNDDDFGIGGLGTYIAKILPATGQVDSNKIYFVQLKAAVK